MKLKYYLRGLAVGVILTTIILAIANADNKPMTDAQVRQRALELGMVESDSIKLSDLQPGNEKESANEEKPSNEDLETDKKENDNDSSIDIAETEEMTSAQTSSEQTSLEQTSLVSESVSAESIPGEGASAPSAPPASESTDITASVTIVIKSGDSSYTVSKALAAAGMVEDAVEFDNYLCNYGYSRTIRTGTYEITSGMSFEEIAKMIAR